MNLFLSLPILVLQYLYNLHFKNTYIYTSPPTIRFTYNHPLHCPICETHVFESSFL